jgi:hypothetical protein
MRSCKPGDEVIVMIEPVIKQGPLRWCGIPAGFPQFFASKSASPQFAFARAFAPCSLFTTIFLT